MGFENQFLQCFEQQFTITVVEWRGSLITGLLGTNVSV